MSTINKNEKIILVYKNNKIRVSGKNIEAILSISRDELYRIYAGNIGEGTISLDVKIDEPVGGTNA